MTYRVGESVFCPGTRVSDRRHAARASVEDRRRGARSVPCRHRWGRVTVGQWEVRLRRLDQEPLPGHVMVLECPDCRCQVEFANATTLEAA